MAEQGDDYLWNRAAAPDPKIELLERALAPYSARSLGLAERALPQVSLPRRTWYWRPTLLAAAATLAAAFIAFQYRLGWRDGASWEAILESPGGGATALSVDIGGQIETGSNQTATIQVARIGHIVLSPGSSLQLIETRRGDHHVELQHGRMRARIWAPPTYFRVAHGNAQIVDLGCEFEVTVEPSGAGSLSVVNGWVLYSTGHEEVLVPQGHTASFDDAFIRTPVRIDAPASLHSSVQRLDQLLIEGGDVRQIEAASASVANDAEEKDRLTLLSILTRHPQLANGALYPRLAGFMGHDPRDENHRMRWARGDDAAINAWWDELPKPPKAWWLNWRDALGG